MADGTARNSGRFEGGRSGNPAGHPKKVRELRSPADYRRVIADVANTLAPMKVGERTKMVTIFERNVVAYATGSAPNRLAAKGFIDLVVHSAQLEWQLGPNKGRTDHGSAENEERGYAG